VLLLLLKQLREPLLPKLLLLQRTKAVAAGCNARQQHLVASPQRPSLLLLLLLLLW
jgi:hypothetical protein